MINKRKISSEKAFKEACKRNGLSYKKHNKGTKTDSIKLVDEEGNSFYLNNDLTIKKCSLEDDNELAVAREGILRGGKVCKRLKSSYKIQKGLQKA
ncbi:hypothetical protein [Herbinix luporum]|jgi:hypothetical protein|uniref:Uncharacterized protein n=1 Tax=Herbinix luporum TaxID=1679721 RepID=A0A0K8J548_9FIRM|nr:hypothetical protein [Herbinix luporum]MDI9487732.1 hypothetical protein [Bacillota bacterium]CUH92474.1 hypothetical protein SD1D_0927 [Herbinix luporum]HHT57075.1 hypothetical protein [Herbinix luporum]